MQWYPEVASGVWRFEMVDTLPPHTPYPRWEVTGTATEGYITINVMQSGNIDVKQGITYLFMRKQESIPVGCVPPACRPYMWWPPLGVCSRWTITSENITFPQLRWRAVNMIDKLTVAVWETAMYEVFVQDQFLCNRIDSWNIFYFRVSLEYKLGDNTLLKTLQAISTYVKQEPSTDMDTSSDPVHSTPSAAATHSSAQSTATGRNRFLLYWCGNGSTCCVFTTEKW